MAKRGAPSGRERWRRALEQWAIPPEILERAPESPWGFPPALFKPSEQGPIETPSRRRAVEALAEGASVLDVGAGAGAAGLALAPPAGSITAVDESSQMLDAFAREAAARDIPHRVVAGRWPDAAAAAGEADVVVCHHVFYNVADLGPFVEALTRAARRRVVVEMTEVHPASALNDLWRHFHHLERPTGPSYEDALEVLAETGHAVDVERWRRPSHRHRADRREIVAFARRRLCLPAERDAEIDELIGDRDVWSPTSLVTISWKPRV